jgi:hypothetical protein
MQPLKMGSLPSSLTVAGMTLVVSDVTPATLLTGSALAALPVGERPSSCWVHAFTATAEFAAVSSFQFW